MLKKFKLKPKIVAPIFLILVLAPLIAYLASHNIQVLNPKGIVASKERRLIIESTLLMLIVVIPVYILTFGIAWKYRASNKKAKYQPDFDGHRGLESAWWAIPGVIILILSIITWQSSHALDPFKPLSSTTRPLKIQVVALQWRWLFIYPEQDIATINYLQIPTKTPISFDITSDAPMNSFWIPQLGGQVYAMSGMSMQLHLSADQEGLYRGSSANISGEGFASMHFIAKATKPSDFAAWASSLKDSPVLSNSLYDQLSKPSHDSSHYSFSLTSSDLYDSVIAKYTSPDHSLANSQYTHEDHHD